MSGFLIELSENGVLDAYWRDVYRLGESKARRIYSQAMNRKGRTGYTRVVRAIAKQSSIKQKDVRAETRFIRASPATLTTTIKGAGGAFPLRYFKAKQFNFGVRAKVWGRSQRFKSAFIYAGTPKSGIPVSGGNVFRRTSGSSYPIKRMHGPAVPVEMLKDDSVDAFEDNARAILTEVERLIAAKI